MQIAEITMTSNIDTENISIVITDTEQQLENMDFFHEHYKGITYDSEDPQVTITQLVYPKHVETVECHFCDLTIPKDKAFTSELYAMPFDTEPEDIYFCSKLCYQCHYGRVYSKDFQYFYCEGCGRDICEQCPSNGWHVQCRLLNDEMICNKCYEEQLFENGVDLESLENRALSGLFFNDSELRDHGFSEVHCAFIQSSDSINQYCEKAIELIKSGHKVITNYESLGIGGGEGHVSMWSK